MIDISAAGSVYKTIVITGANGMLGHALTDALHARGLKPILLPRAQCDLANEKNVERIFDHHPTLLLNCAAHTKVDQCEQEPELAHRVNGSAIGQMASLSRESGTTLVQVSTDFVFNGRGTRPYKIDEPVAPLSVYGKSKLLGETQLQENAPANWLIIRTAWVYGRHGANFPRTMITVAKAGKPLAVVSDQVGAPTYTVDLAAGILALVDKKSPRYFFTSPTAGRPTGATSPKPAWPSSASIIPCRRSRRRIGKSRNPTPPRARATACWI